MSKTISGYFDIAYFIKFALIFLALYGLNEFMIGITTPGGIYSPFMDQYLNYPAWVRTTVLYGAKTICFLFGYPSIVDSDVLENLSKTKLIRMGWPCYGLMIMAFWFAFIMAHNGKLKSRARWAVLGLMAITLTNCIRISLLYFSLMEGWKLNDAIDNHDMFKYASYIVVALMIFLFKSKFSSSPKLMGSNSIPAIV